MAWNFCMAWTLLQYFAAAAARTADLFGVQRRSCIRVKRLSSIALAMMKLFLRILLSGSELLFMVATVVSALEVEA